MLEQKVIVSAGLAHRCRHCCCARNGLCKPPSPAGFFLLGVVFSAGRPLLHENFDHGLHIELLEVRVVLARAQEHNGQPRAESTS